MADLKYYDIILKPLVTEKSMMAMEEKSTLFQCIRMQQNLR